MITKYDVFLSRKTQDAHLADKVYQHLTAKGLKVFDAAHELSYFGDSDFRKSILKALSMSEHLLVIGSSVENISARWVEEEWSIFLDKILANEKDGNIITLITRNIRREQLPDNLRKREILFFEDGFDRLVYYFGANLNKLSDPYNKNTGNGTGSLTNPEEDYQMGEALYKGYKFSNTTILIECSKTGTCWSSEQCRVYVPKKVGCFRELPKALKWFLKAANQKSTAECNIGSLYLHGLGVQQNANEAVKWYAKAADRICSGMVI